MAIGIFGGGYEKKVLKLLLVLSLYAFSGDPYILEIEQKVI